MTTQDKLFDQYESVRSKYLDPETNERRLFFSHFVRAILRPHMGDDFAKNILEIGCDKGYLLKSLLNDGFSSLEGIDLCKESIEIARKETQLSTLHQSSLFDFLPTKKNAYDIIISKAVMEHIPKNNQELFVKLIHESLNSKGIGLILVPNMDWILSNHERYMDFTHEIGYTKESFSDIFRLYFDSVTVIPVTYTSFPITLKQKINSYFIRPIVISILRLFFRIIGDGASDVAFEYRAILAIVKKA